MRRTIYLLLFLVLAGLAGVLTLRAQRTVAVLVAVHDLRAGAQIGATDVTLQRLHEDSIPVGALSNADDAVGLYVAWPLTAGEPVLGRAVRHQRTGLALVADVAVPDGYRAVAVPVQPAGAVGGMLSAGDHVDVYATPLPGHDAAAGGAVAMSSTSSGGSSSGTGHADTANGTSGNDSAPPPTDTTDSPPAGASATQLADGTLLLGRDLLVLQLRSDQGQALDSSSDRSVHGLDFGAGKLGSVVLAVPAAEVARFAAASASDTIYLALSVG